MDTYKAAMAAWTPPGIGQAVGAANVAASVAMGAMQLANLFKVAPDGSNAEGLLCAVRPRSYARHVHSRITTELKIPASVSI